MDKKKDLPPNLDYIDNKYRSEYVDEGEDMVNQDERKSINMAHTNPGDVEKYSPIWSSINRRD